MIITRSPLRVSLGGGGTDLPSYYREHGGFLVAAAIDKYIYITQHRTFAQEIIVKRCVPCHSTHPADPAFPAPPNNIVFETPEQIKLMVPRIRERAVESKTMPFLNKTQISPLERAELGKWIVDGARLQ
jgi:uncharacterized membrane protein